MENKIILLVATSKDGFIADQYGNGDFSSIEDKQQFRAFLHSNQCDCFVCGRKTAEEFKERLTYKPLFILSSKEGVNENNCVFIKNLADLYKEMKQRNLSRCALLGGAKTYHYFLANNAVQEIHQTEENLFFKKGVFLDLEQYTNNFSKVHIQTLSKNTRVITYIHSKQQKALE